MDAVLDLLVASIDDPSAVGIAGCVSRLITSGDIPEGTRLPTVRGIATALSISPTTVSQAWKALTSAGLVQARSRAGTVVLAQTAGRRVRRAAYLGPPSVSSLDLSSGTPDPALLPLLGGALSRLGDRSRVSNYQDETDLPDLVALLRQRWPYDVETVTVVDGSLDGMDRVLERKLRLGDRVLVETPTYPPILDLLDLYGAQPVGLPMDHEGIRPEALAQALEKYNPVALIVQPRAQNPTGTVMSFPRLKALARILMPHRAFVIEDDHIGDVSLAEPLSFGMRLPQRTIRISSFSKSHGPDLRIAGLGGPHELLVDVMERRMLGPGWTSRILQSLVVDLLRNPESVSTVKKARTTYGRRRKTMLAHLGSRGVQATGYDGLNLWVEVRDERAAMLALASHGIAVGAGTLFTIPPVGKPHIRVTIAAVDRDYALLADHLAEAAQAVPGRRPAR